MALTIAKKQEESELKRENLRKQKEEAARQKKI